MPNLVPAAKGGWGEDACALVVWWLWWLELGGQLDGVVAGRWQQCYGKDGKWCLEIDDGVDVEGGGDCGGGCGGDCGGR